jgi:hypothetical protein
MVVDREHVMARARWSSAEDRLYPALIANPGGYERALYEIRAVLAELRRRADDLPGLIASEASPDEVLACACPSGPRLPVDLLLGAACAMRAREIAARAEARR